jgi:hypothetical protein
MRLNFARLDGLAVILLVVGVVALAASMYAALRMIAPLAPPATAPASTSTVVAPPVLAADHVATSLNVDAGLDSAAAARPGDHVDILGYFSRQVTGGEGMTRVLLTDVAVLGVGRDAGRVALTLALRQEEALLLQQVQALGVRPFVALRSARAPLGSEALPTAITDRDLTLRLQASIRASDARR